MHPKAPAIASLFTACCLAGSSLSAQLSGDPTIILRENQLIPNLGTIQSVTRIAVSDQGTVFTQASITTNSLRYMMRDAFATFANNILLPEPPPPGIYTMTGKFPSFELDDRTNVAWRLQSNNTGGGTGSVGTHTGIYFNLKLIHNDVDSAHTLAGVQTPFNGSIPSLGSWGYRTFFNIDLNNDNQILVNCQLDTNGTANGGNVASGMILVDVDDFGNILNETMLVLGDSNVKDTDIKFNGILNKQNSFQLANNGNWAATVQFDRVNGINTNKNNDWGIVANSPTNIIVRENMAVPGVGTVDTSGSNSARVSINAFGDVAYMVRFAGKLERIVSKGVLLAAEGNAALGLASLAPDKVKDLESNGQPPLTITDSGDVYWYAKLTGANSRNRAFMRNQEVLIRKGISTIGGVLIRDLTTTERGYTLSNNGRYWAGLVRMAGGGDDVVILFDLGLVLPIPGTDTNPSSLSKLSGDARTGELLVMSMDGPQGPGALPTAYFSLAASIPDSPLGIPSKLGELFIDFTPGVFLTQISGSPATTGPSSIAVNIPLDPSLVGLEVFAQGAYFDQGSSNGGAVFNLTNGIKLIIGAS